MVIWSPLVLGVTEYPTAGLPYAADLHEILYEELVATRPGLERKGKTMPYTSVNGHMFSFLTSEGTLALRLPQAERRRVPRGL